MSLWTTEELLQLLQAWDEIQGYVGESERSHCGRIYDRFTELRGGYTERTEQAIYLQRSVLAYNHQLIVDYDRVSKLNGSTSGWFMLSPHRRAQAFHANESKSYRFVDLDEAMFAAISRIKKRAPLQIVPRAKPQVSKKQAKAKQQVAKKKVWEKQEDDDDSRMIAYEWTHDELLNLVHAWRDELRDYHSHRGSTPAAKMMNARIYVRFTINCNGSTTRSEAAVTTKKRDLVHSYQFIAKINAQQRKNHQRTWFSMSKIEKLAIFRSVERSSHLGDVPEDIFLRIGKIMNKERALGLRGKRQADELEDDESEEEGLSCKAAPSSSRGQLGGQAASRSEQKKKQKLQSSVEHQLSFQEAVSRGAGEERQARDLRKKRPGATNLDVHLAELRQIATVHEEQARRVKEIVREIELTSQVGGSSAALQAKKEGPYFAARARSVSYTRGPRKGVRETKVSDNEPQANEQEVQAHETQSEKQEDPRSTRSLAQETIWQLQNQGGMGSAWL